VRRTADPVPPRRLVGLSLDLKAAPSAAEAVPFPGDVKIKVKSSGQWCPLQAIRCNSSFLTGLSARFGMTKFVCRREAYHLFIQKGGRIAHLPESLSL
jgi:hypothetical protein